MYELPELTYDYDALEPVIDARTMELHHGYHHAGYVAGANRALETILEARAQSQYQSINTWQQDLAFHASGHVMHSRFWQSMHPNRTAPDTELAAMIDRDFGSLSALRDQMSAAASGVQGSGWVALSWEPTARQLVVNQILNHQHSTLAGATPLLTIDVWEHAYYLKHQNRRGDWIAAFWEVADWAHASTHMANLRDEQQDPAP